MTKFEEEFPNLKDKYTPSEDDKWSSDDDMVDIRDIQEHCLDKQKVIEALQRARGLSSMSSEVMVTIRRIEKDLGLEK